MEHPYSAKALEQFLDWAAEKHIIKQATAKSRKIAAQKILDALDDSEKIDLKTLDVENAFQRFVNKSGHGFTPDSLATYKSRFNKALEDFFAYKQNPSGFRPSLAQRSTRARKDGDANGGKPRTPRDSRSPPSTEQGVPEHQVTATGTFDFPVPLPSGVLAMLRLPKQLTFDDAERISAVVKALAVSGKESGQ